MSNKKCNHRNEIGKCVLKVPTRHNDFCEEDDHPKSCGYSIRYKEKNPTEHPHTLLEKGKLYDAMKEQRDELLKLVEQIKDSINQGKYCIIEIIYNDKDEFVDAYIN